FKAVVFDLDATLVDLGRHVSWDRAHENIVQAYISCGCPEEFVHSCSSLGLFKMMNKMWDNLISKDEQFPMETQERIYSILEEFEMEGTDICSPLDGALDCIKWLNERELPVGICTSNSQKVAERIIERLGWSPYIKAIVGREQGVKMKPDPEQLLICFNAIGVRPEEGVMVGDSPDDMKAGRAAGCYNIGIPSSFNEPSLLLQSGANILIDSLRELPESFRTLKP
ncbi:MAG: HAD family hydrolase, partial [Candidatus Bathyarchaeia archaeon]